MQGQKKRGQRGRRKSEEETERIATADVVRDLFRSTDVRHLDHYATMALRWMKEESDPVIDEIVDEVERNLRSVPDTVKRVIVLYVLNEEPRFQNWVFRAGQSEVPDSVRASFLSGLQRLCTAHSERKLNEPALVYGAGHLYDALLSNRIAPMHTQETS